jgi:hypothetical protein
VLFRNCAAIGGFNETGSPGVGWYWLGAPKKQNGTVCGLALSAAKDFGPSLRCVR